MVTVGNSLFNSNKQNLKISLVGTPFPLNFLCGNAVPMRSRPTTPLGVMLSYVNARLSLLQLFKIRAKHMASPSG